MYTYIPISPPSFISLPPSLFHPSRWTQSTELISLCYGGVFLKDIPACPSSKLKPSIAGDFPGGPVIKTSPSNAGGAGSIPGQGAKIPHASWPKNQNRKQKQHCNKFNKDFKNGPQQKNLKKKTALHRGRRFGEPHS